MSGIESRFCLAWCIIAVSYLSATFASAQSTYITTNYGLIIGQSTPVLNSKVFTFLGIPYARPPVGEDRFRKPRPPVIPPIFQANRIRLPCPQFGLTTPTSVSEDCLYLNIYVPKGPKKPPVFIWIYGYGSFTQGDAQKYDAELLAVRGGVVVVTFNYRLGVLGFLSSGDNLLPGNLGLFDQHMVFTWIKTNIGSFGGDPERITICGLSSGAASVGLHMLNPLSRSLFHRAIMQSGGSTSSWTINRRPRDTFLQLASRLDCYNRNETNDANLIEGIGLSRDIIRCFRTRTAREMVEADLSILKDSGPIKTVIDKLWVPVIDGDFIVDDPSTLLNNISHLQRAGFYEYDLLTGVTEGEGDMFYYSLVPALMTESHIPFNKEGSRVQRDFFVDEVIPSLVWQRFGSAPYIAKDAIVHRYENLDLDKKDEDKRSYVSIDLMLRSYEDPAFNAPVIEQCRRHVAATAAARKTFMYLQGHVIETDSQTKVGLSHGADAPYLFGLGPKVTNGTKSENITEGDQRMSDIIIKYWTNFVKSGDPNKPDTTVPVTWPEYERTNEHYIILSSNMSRETSIGRHLYSERGDFWINYLPKLYKISQGLPTSCGETRVEIKVTPPTTPGTTRPTTSTSIKSTRITTQISQNKTTNFVTIASTARKRLFTLPPLHPGDRTWVDQQLEPTTEKSKNTAECNTLNNGRLERFNMDTAMAETTIIALIAVCCILGVLSLVVSCMLCARRRSDPDMGKF